MKRNSIITISVLCWLVIFNYESTRHFYLEPFFKRPLPKLKLLFPPAGWIMFFNVDEQFGYAQVYGVKNSQSYPIDPHQILQTRAIGYDNINRNVLGSVLNRDVKEPFCVYLRRKFSSFDSFIVTYIQYPSVVKQPFESQQVVVYECR